MTEIMRACITSTKNELYGLNLITSESKVNEIITLSIKGVDKDYFSETLVI